MSGRYPVPADAHAPHARNPTKRICAGAAARDEAVEAVDARNEDLVIHIEADRANRSEGRARLRRGDLMAIDAAVAQLERVVAQIGGDDATARIGLQARR